MKLRRNEDIITLNELNRRLSDMEISKSENDAIIGDKNKLLKMLENQCQELSSVIEYKGCEVQKLRSNVVSLNEKLEIIVHEKSNTLHEKSLLLDECNAIELRWNDAKLILDSLMKQIEIFNIKSGIDVSVVEPKELLNHLEKLILSHNEYKLGFEDKEVQLKTVQENLFQTKEKINSVTQESLTLHLELQTAQKSSKRLSSDVTYLESELSVSQSQQSKLRHELIDARNQLNLESIALANVKREKELLSAEILSYQCEQSIFYR
jgi:chromosome segregation ATPase